MNQEEANKKMDGLHEEMNFETRGTKIYKITLGDVEFFPVQELKEKVEKLKDEQLALAEGPMDDVTRMLRFRAQMKNEAFDEVLILLDTNK